MIRTILLSAFLVLALAPTATAYVLGESDCQAILPPGYRFESANVSLRPEILAQMDFEKDMDAEDRRQYDEVVAEMGFDPKTMLSDIEEALACEYRSPDGTDDFEVGVIKMKDADSAKQMMTFYRYILKEIVKAFSGLFSSKEEFDEAEFEREWNEKIIEDSATAFVVRGDDEDAGKRSGMFTVGSYVVVVGSGTENFNSIRSSWEGRLRGKPGGSASIGSAIAGGIAGAISGTASQAKEGSETYEKSPGIVSKVVETAKSVARKAIDYVKSWLGGGSGPSDCAAGEIRHGRGCCADANGNRICDADE